MESQAETLATSGSMRQREARSATSPGTVEAPGTTAIPAPEASRARAARTTSETKRRLSARST